MKLKLFYSAKNMVVRLVNIDGVDSKKSSNRVLESWMQDNGTNMRITYWKNDMRCDLNPHYYNRVNLHFTNHSNIRVTQSYYCIHDYIQLEDMTLNDFDESRLV